MQPKVKMTMVAFAIAGTLGIIVFAGYDLVFPSSSPRPSSKNRSSSPRSQVERRSSEVPRPKQVPLLPRQRVSSQHRAPKSMRASKEAKGEKSSENIGKDAKENEPKVAVPVAREDAQLGFERIMNELDEHIATGKKLPFRQRRQLLEQAGRAFSAWSATLDMDQPGEAAEFEAAYVDFQMRASQLELTAEPPPKKRKYPLE